MFHQNSWSCWVFITDSQRIRTDTQLLFQLTRSIAAGWILHLLILTTAGRQSLAAEASNWLCYGSFLSAVRETRQNMVVIRKKLRVFQTCVNCFLSISSFFLFLIKSPENVVGLHGLASTLEGSHVWWPAAIQTLETNSNSKVRLLD